ncbi:MAG: hypothetical protein O9264_08800 [Leptospira sp.]|nr:hypothetical protein [Leptospira sp.]
MTKFFKQTKKSFNDKSLRLTGLVILIICIICEFITILSGGSSTVQITESIHFPGFIGLGSIGLLMFLMPYIVLGYKFYREMKENKKENQEDNKGE